MLESEILVKNCDFFIPPLYSKPPLGGPRRTIAFPFGLGKLEWWVYPTVKKVLTVCLPILTECTNVTDIHTDRQTDTTLRQNAGQRPRLMQASRGKNEVEGVWKLEDTLNIYCVFTLKVLLI